LTLSQKVKIIAMLKVIAAEWPVVFTQYSDLLAENSPTEPPAKRTQD
jgi:hypothetical protein